MYQETRDNYRLRELRIWKHMVNTVDKILFHPTYYAKVYFEGYELSNMNE